MLNHEFYCLNHVKHGEIMVKSAFRIVQSPFLSSPQVHHGWHMAGRRAIRDELRAGALRPGLVGGVAGRRSPGGLSHPGSHVIVRLGG